MCVGRFSLFFKFTVTVSILKRTRRTKNEEEEKQTKFVFLIAICTIIERRQMKSRKVCYEQPDRILPDGESSQVARSSLLFVITKVKLKKMPEQHLVTPARMTA